jgi:hypothetical protein
MHWLVLVLQIGSGFWHCAFVQHSPVLQVPEQQRSPLPAFEHCAFVSQATHWPWPLQIGCAGFVHWPLLQQATARQEPLQHF